MGGHDIGELAFGEIAPFAGIAEQVTYNDIRAARLVECGHYIRSDKTGPTGHQQHAAPCPVQALSFAPVRPGRQLQPIGVVKAATATLPGPKEPLPKCHGWSSTRYEYEFRSCCSNGGRGRYAPHPDRPLYVDWRLRARPQRGAPAQPAFPEPARRPPHHDAVRAADRLYAGRPRTHRVGPAARPTGYGQAMGLGGRTEGPPLRHGAGPAPDLEIGDCTGFGWNPRARGFCRRSQIRAAQPMALGRKGAASFYRQERGLGLARGRGLAAGMAGAAIARAARGGRPLSAGQGPRPGAGGRAGARLGRLVQTLDLLSASRPAPGRTRGDRKS